MATSEPTSSTEPVSVTLTIAPPPDDAVVYSPPPPYEVRDEQDSSPGKETGKLFLSSVAKGFLFVLFLRQVEGNFLLTCYYLFLTFYWEQDLLFIPIFVQHLRSVGGT